MAEALNKAAFDISHNGNTAEEPSMDEILASIRQIIAEDERSKRVEDDRSLFEHPGNVSNRNEQGAAPPMAPFPNRAGRVEPLHAELNPDVSAAFDAAFAAKPKVETAPVSPAPAPFALPNAAPLRTPVAQAPAPAAVPKLDEERIARDVAQRWLGTHEGELRAVVEEVVRPIIRQWMAQNLPNMVERLIREEVSAAAQRRGRR